MRFPGYEFLSDKRRDSLIGVSFGLEREVQIAQDFIDKKISSGHKMPVKLNPNPGVEDLLAKAKKFIYIPQIKTKYNNLKSLYHID